ncbi:histidine kinase [Nonomuraea sp. NBC_01738]|uniref:sensor histidine kinase n=1 Tax=Nonomuraea sp. NBC_01738 TaxID=2976003 RepID=UPI002E15E162|nr:histidine kinase [Nonomuraea sp. NBC_01738]
MKSRLLAARRSPLPADALLAAVIFLATLGPGQVPAGGPWPLVFQVAVVAPLVWRRRAPLVVFCVIAVAAGLQWAAGVQLPADAALLVALYTVAARRTWKRALAAGLVLEAGVLLAAARWAPAGQFPFTAAALSALAAAALTTGLWARARRAYVTSLEHDREQRVRLAVAEERARMTRDMHDIVTHNLSVMVALADSALHVRRSAPEQAALATEQISVTGRQALADMRRSLGSDDRLDPAPGIAQLGPLAERMRAAGLPTRVEVAGDPGAVPTVAQLTVYRVVQEALTNTLRHAPGATALVRVDVSVAGRAGVEVVDDGRAAGRSGGGGRGLVGMRERVAAYGADLIAGPRPDGGWRVATDLDLTRTSRADTTPSPGAGFAVAGAG